MTSMMTGGVFNAFAFAGAGYLFKYFDKNKYGDEMERHNKAMEKLARDKEAWSEAEIEHRDKIQRMRQELSDANKNINDTNKALEIFARHNPKPREPQLRDYYTPSPEMEKYQEITEIAMGLGVGWIGYKILKRVNVIS